MIFREGLTEIDTVVHLNYRSHLAVTGRTGNIG